MGILYQTGPVLPSGARAFPGPAGRPAPRPAFHGISPGGSPKNNEYNFYRYAGVATAERGKGEHIGEEEPVNPKSNLP